MSNRTKDIVAHAKTAIPANLKDGFLEANLSKRKLKKLKAKTARKADRAAKRTAKNQRRAARKPTKVLTGSKATVSINGQVIGKITHFDTKPTKSLKSIKKLLKGA